MLRAMFGRERFSIELQRPYWRGDARRNRLLAELADRLRVGRSPPATPTPTRPRRAYLQDALVAIRLNTTLDACERTAAATTRRCCARPAETAARFPDRGGAGAAQVADRCRFDLTRDLGYSYPRLRLGDRRVGRGRPPPDLLRRAGAPLRRPPPHPRGPRPAEPGAGPDRATTGWPASSCCTATSWRWPARSRGSVRGQSAARRLLPPGRGRGSSVGSIVCYLIGLSHVDPVATRLFLGRFLSRDLVSVPDIDLDFPRDVREGLILEVERRYGTSTPRWWPPSPPTGRGARSATWARRWRCRRARSSGWPS